MKGKTLAYLWASLLLIPSCSFLAPQQGNPQQAPAATVAPTPTAGEQQGQALVYQKSNV